jgi:hypothetical protein
MVVVFFVSSQVNTPDSDLAFSHSAELFNLADS